MRCLVRSFLVLATTMLLMGAHTTALAQMGGGMFQGGMVAGGAPSGATQPVAPVDVSAEVRQLRRPHASATDRVAALNSKDVVEPPAPAAVHLSPARQRFMQLLLRQSSFDFVDTPLVDVADWLKKQLGCNVVLDRQALEDEAIDPTSEGVTFAAKDMTYQSALYHMLGQLNLTYTIEHEVLLITSAERAEETLGTHVYPVWDLTKSARAEEQSDYDTLIEVITKSIRPNSWDDVGGPGSINAYKGIITATNSYAVHTEIAKLLTGLRACSANLAKASGPQAELEVIDLRLSPGTDAAALLLSESMPFQFLDTPLVDVVGWIRNQSPVNVLLDRQALEDEGIDPSSDTVTIDVKDVSVRAGLDLMLEDFNLTYVVDHEALVITSRETAEERLRTKVYSCAGVIDIVDASDLEQLRAELEELAELISNTVALSSWDVVGGPGSMSPFPARGLLVIRQTASGHDEIAAFLRQLLQARAGRRTPLKPSPAAIEVRSYRLSPSFAEQEARNQLIGLITRLLQDTDNAVNTSATNFTIEGLPGGLVVSHRRDAQQPIHRLLEKLDALARAPQSMRGGMF